jgi:predicted enzyme related to lactoylglutathione lyase
MPSGPELPPLTAAVYAHDAARLAAFYEQALGLQRLEAGASFVLLGAAGLELAVVQVPPAVAATFSIDTPPQLREDTPLKLSLRVADIEALRTAITAQGGGLKPPEAAWSWRGARHLDGWDAEGNVFQLRQREV